MNNDKVREELDSISWLDENGVKVVQFDEVLEILKTKWQPIETAPKDKEIDAYGYLISDSGVVDNEFKRYTNCYWGERNSQYVARKYGKEGWCTNGDDGWSWGVELTHWQPLPNPPEKK
jgi:hypothetical protein